MNWNGGFSNSPDYSQPLSYQVPQSTFTHIRNDDDAADANNNDDDDADGPWLILTFGTANRCRIRGRAAYSNEPAY